MELKLSEDQAMLVSSLQSILDRHQDLPAEHRRDRSYYSWDLDSQIVANGFLDAARTEGMGALEAALVVVETATVPAAVETGASALIAPHLPGLVLPRPIALISGDIAKAQRYLPVARCALMEVDGDVLVIPVDAENVEAVDSIYAYPYGRFKTLPDLSKVARLGPAAVAPLRQWWRVSIAAECAGLMRKAVEFTVDYVKQRRMFGTTLGTYQAVQHRLAQCHQIATGTYYLALKAAWTGDAFDAAQAASFAQQHIQKLTFDLHQFNGGMGVTNEHKLHFWTYRFRALQAEMGGANGAAVDTATLLWGEPGRLPPKRDAAMEAARSSQPA
jgi:alkylation response protein AidB-like acyl-CoA dehydrogenase